MNNEEIENLVLSTLDDLKAVDTIALDVRHLSSITDTMIFTTGTSSRHVKSIASNLLTEVKHNGLQPLGLEGEADGEWILFDLGDIVVHIMQAHTREFYNLEKLWNSATAATE